MPDLDVLEQVPTEKSKYYGIGGTIVFTALMASFACGYAFHTAFKDSSLSVFFGLFWGALIFNLDRYIVSFGVGDGKRTISRREALEAAPRLLMAALLGFVIRHAARAQAVRGRMKPRSSRQSRLHRGSMHQRYEGGNSPLIASWRRNWPVSKLSARNAPRMWNESAANTCMPIPCSERNGFAGGFSWLKERERYGPS